MPHERRNELTPQERVTPGEGNQRPEDLRCHPKEHVVEARTAPRPRIAGQALLPPQTNVDTLGTRQQLPRF